MDPTELLKQVGLTQYEAEAYSTLLREGPLTGYELGKRSKVPLPRSYDVIERLVDRGLALVQPSESAMRGGDAPRYRAQEPAHFLAGLRAGMESRLGQLESELAGIASPALDQEFWVIRGRQRIVARVVAMIGDAKRTLSLVFPAPLESELREALAAARGRDLNVVALNCGSATSGELSLLVDGVEALVGAVAPEPCQAVVTRNRGLVEMVDRSFATGAHREDRLPAVNQLGELRDESTDWLDWEGDKHRRLRLLIGGNSDVA